jgi:Carboxypeptidase regulatory-like domain
VKRLLVLALTSLCASLCARSVRAQLVRGTVTESTSRGPVAGVLVELFAAGESAPPGTGRAASALSAVDGTFALRAPAPGRYRLVAKRIGVRRFDGAPFTLAPGETRTQDIALDAVEYRLPAVLVTASALCAAEPGDRLRVAALWEEARTALDAAEISLRDKLFTAQVTRYVRELEPRSLRVLRETRSEVRGVVASPFAALPAESLSAHGFWRAADGGGAHYYGPDARVLLSDAFLGDHCFRAVSGKGARDGLVGLAFAPVANRPVPDVVGTLWMDARTFELRLVEFRYDRVREGVDRDKVGGEVHFARLGNGAWIVQRWHLRVPMLGRPRDPLATEGNAPWILVRPTLLALSEEGGVVTTDEMRPSARPARVAGVVRDSGGRRALAGASVRIGGTARAVVADGEGRFAFDSLAPGLVTVVVGTPGYDSLGLVAADQSLELRSGESRRLLLTAHDTRALTARLCQGRAAPWGRGTLHLTVRDSASGAVIAGLGATVHWMSTFALAPGDSVPALAEGTTDARGTVTFCEVPAGRVVTLRVAHPQGGTAAPRALVLGARALHHVELLVGARLPNE